MALYELNTIKDLELELGIEKRLLRDSLTTGMLHGIAAPKHKVVNGVVYFPKPNVLQWLDSLNDKNCEGM